MGQVARISEDPRGGKAYGGYLEMRASDLDAAMNDASLAELRRGWYLGEKSFAEKVLATLSGEEFAAKKQKRSVAGDAATASRLEELEKRLVLDFWD